MANTTLAPKKAKVLRASKVARALPPRVARRVSTVKAFAGGASTHLTPTQSTGMALLRLNRLLKSAQNALERGVDKGMDARAVKEALEKQFSDMKRQLDELQSHQAVVPTAQEPAVQKKTSSGNAILEQAKEQSRQFRDELIAKGLVAASGEICEALNFKRQSLNKAVKDNRIFFLKHGNTQYYPVFYADGELDRAQLERVSQVLGDLDGASKWQFFTRPKGSLGGITPLEALKAKMLDKVLQAAQGFVER